MAIPSTRHVRGWSPASSNLELGQAPVEVAGGEAQARCETSCAAAEALRMPRAHHLSVAVLRHAPRGRLVRPTQPFQACAAARSQPATTGSWRRDFILPKPPRPGMASRDLPLAHIPCLLRAPVQNLFKLNSRAIGTRNVVNRAEVLPQPACAFECGIAALTDRDRCFAVLVGEMHHPHAGFHLVTNRRPPKTPGKARRPRIFQYTVLV